VVATIDRVETQHGPSTGIETNTAKQRRYVGSGAGAFVRRHGRAQRRRRYAVSRVANAFAHSYPYPQPFAACIDPRTATHSPTFPSAPTLPAFTAVPPPTLTPGLLVSPVLLATLPSATPAPPTATLKPFPQVTYQYPGRTPTYTLLARQAQSPVDDPPKGGGLSLRQIWRGLRSAAPWLILVGLWIGLALWFIVAQFLLRRIK